MKTMMKAIVIRRFGAPDVFEARDVERSEPLAGEVLPLEEARRAHERLDTGHGRGRGKIILRTGARP